MYTRYKEILDELPPIFIGIPVYFRNHKKTRPENAEQGVHAQIFIMSLATMKISLYEIYLLMYWAIRVKKEEVVTLGSCKHSIIKVYILI